MYALLAMTHALSPSRLDENILTSIRERHGEQFNKLLLGLVLVDTDYDRWLNL